LRFRDNAYAALFSNRSYRRFWGGFALSSLGDAMARVALTWYVLEQTDSARAVGYLALAYTAPILVGGLLAGVLLDRFDRRKVMALDNLVRGVAMAIVPLLHFLGLLEVWHVYVAAAVFGSLMMISLAGGPSLIPSIIPRQQLTAANAFETLGFTVAGVVGPPIAGLLIASVGAPNVLILDALSYFVYALALAGVRYIEDPETAGGAAAAGRRGSTSLGDAIRLLRGDRVLLSTTFMYMSVNVGLGAAFVWMPIYVERTLGGGAGLYGLLLGALAAGETVSSILSVSFNRWLPLGTLICLAGVLAGLAYLPLLAGVTALAIVSMALFGALTAPLTIWAQTLRMEIIPAAMRGRTFALLRMMMQGSQPIGGALGGFLLPVVGIGAMIAVSATMVSGASIVASRVRELRLAGAPPEPANTRAARATVE
jgi:MFS family permease